MYSCMHGQAPQYLMDFLPSDLQRRITATTSICQPTTPGRSTLLAKYHRPTGFLCRWSVGVEFFAGLLEQYCCWQSRHIQTTFENVSCSLRTSAYSALLVSRLCARLYKFTLTLTLRSLLNCHFSTALHLAQKYHYDDLTGFDMGLPQATRAAA